MKRLFLALVLFLAGVPALAQTTIPQTTVGGAYITGRSALVTGQTSVLGLDSSGNLLTSCALGCLPGQPSTATDASGTVTTGGTFQTIAAASTTRKALEFTNVCNTSGNCTAITNLCYVNINSAVSATTANSIPIPPGGSYLRSSGNIPSNAVRVTCDGTGDKFAAEVQ